MSADSGMGSVLEARDLRKHFPASGGRALRAVDGVSLELRKHEILGLVGESGCGKSTLGRLLVGLHERTSGEVRLDGAELPVKLRARDFRRFSRQVQMVFQDPYSSLNPRMTVGEIVAEGPRIHGLWARAEAPARAAEWLRRVGLLPEHLSRYPHEFSGGQRQRIGIARALALEPRVLICDEPISALDVSIQAQVVNLLADLKARLGLSILFIAHDLAMVRYVSDRMAVMYLGGIVEIGGADDVYFRPMHPYTRLLISANPEPDPRQARAKPLTLAAGEVPSPIGEAGGETIGCRFAARCAFATDRCRERAPELREATPGRYVACHFAI